MEIKEESKMKFGFPDENETVKFDDTKFYRKFFDKFSGAKGVDFISVGKESMAFVEIKNCLGDEGNCRWRIYPNNQKKTTTHTKHDVEGRDSLDIEVPQKVAMTLAALAGARSFGVEKTSSEELKNITDFVFSEDLSDGVKKKYVILFLEGDFGGHTRSKKAIMSELQRSMNVKMKWLNCKVSVVDSDTYNRKIFQVIE